MIISFLQTYERHIANLNPMLLVAITVVLLLLGLFVWLGGIGYKKILFALIGAFCGLCFSFSISGANPMLTAALIGGCALLALKLQELFLVLLCSILIATYGFAILIRPYFRTSGELLDMMRDLTIGVPYYNWPILIGLIFAPLAFSATWPQGASAALCSVTSAVMLFAAFMTILTRFGFSPVALMAVKRELYLAIFAGITVAGILVQMLLMPHISRRVAAAKQAAKLKAKKVRKNKRDESESESASSTAWRTS